MNIFFLTETESGCFKWRTAIPAKYLERRGHSVQILSNDLRGYEAPDVLVLSRAHFVEAYKIVEWCKSNSIRVVFDTDDALDLVPRESIYYKGLQPRLPLYKFLLEEADAVTTTTETLASHLRGWNSNVVVIPNSVDPEEWQPAKREPGGIRVGWSGGTDHFTDLALPLDAIREVHKKHPFTFIIQGICKEPTLDAFYQRHVSQYGKAFASTPYGKSMKWALTKLAGIPHEFHPMVEISGHPQTVCGLKLDVGIAPLQENSFNRNKSCVKFYEYAMSGAVTLASHVLPYSSEVPTTVKNTRDWWEQKLEWILTTDRLPMRRQEREWVMEHRNIETNVTLWEGVLGRGDAVTAGPRETSNEAA
jgi:hypothetical protein